MTKTRTRTSEEYERQKVNTGRDPAIIQKRKKKFADE